MKNNFASKVVALSMQPGANLLVGGNLPTLVRYKGLGVYLTDNTSAP